MCESVCVWVSVYVCVILTSSLCILDIKLLSEVLLSHIFFHSVLCHSPDISLCWVEVFQLILVLRKESCTIRVLFRKFLLASIFCFSYIFSLVVLAFQALNKGLWSIRDYKGVVTTYCNKSQKIIREEFECLYFKKAGQPRKNMDNFYSQMT